MERKRVMFVGASGTGKTTLAKYVAGEFNIPFTSGSMSDVVPETKDMPHREMLKVDEGLAFSQEQKYLSRRYNALMSSSGSFVTDRSFIDNVAYAIYKTSHVSSSCDIDSMVDAVSQCLSDLKVTHIIFIPVTLDMVKGWVPENNGKRITNVYFQMMISQIMSGVIPLVMRDDITNKPIDKDSDSTYIQDNWTKLKLLCLEDRDIDVRKRIISKFLKL